MIEHDKDDTAGGLTSCYVHLTDLGFVEYFLRRWISDLPFFESYSSRRLHQPLPPVYPPVREHHRIVLNKALAVVSVGQVPRQLVQLRGADGTDARCRRVCVGRATCVSGMAGWCFESRKSSGERSVQERAIGEREKLVMGVHKQLRQVVPTFLGIHRLKKSDNYPSKRAKETYLVRLHFRGTGKCEQSSGLIYLCRRGSNVLSEVLLSVLSGFE